MNIFLFILTIVVSIIIVRLGAVAFHITGIEWTQAKFQALSCFSGTGFTTRESELVTASPRRRKIATYLIIIGHAGLVAMVATFANSLRPSTFMDKFTLPVLRAVVPSALLPWINLAVIVVAIYVISKIFTSTGFAGKLTSVLRARLVKKELFEPATIEELMLAPGGYGVSQIEVTEEVPFINQTLSGAHLKKADILVLAIERGNKTIPNPPADTTILLGDKLLCFGKIAMMRQEVGAAAG